MDTRGFHRAQCFNRTGQFAFQRTLVVNLLAELADAKFFLIQQFETDSTAFRQTLLREAQAQLMNFICRNFKSPTVLRETVRNVHLR